MSLETSTATGVTRRPGGRTREHTNRIHAATVELLGEGGVAAVTFQEVAARAAISRTTMYRRYPSVEALVADAIRSTAADRIPTPDTGSLVEDLRSVMRDYTAFITSPVGVAIASAGARVGPSPERRAAWTERFGDLAPIFDRARARHEIPDGFDAEALVAMLVGAIHHRHNVMARDVDDRWIERVIAIALD